MKVLVIPDTQVRPGVQTDHLSWIGQYAADKRPDVIVHLGDHWDMPSLSVYDKRGGKAMEGRRYARDVEAGNDAWAELDGPMVGRGWKPRKILLRGNHEQRIERAIEANPTELDGCIGYGDLESPGWEVHDFLAPVWVGGVCFSHYFYNQNTGRPLGSAVPTRLKTIGHSFVMGHQQGLHQGIRETLQGRQRGLVAGSCYLHSEAYRGPQASNEWRGVLMLHEVKDGDYDLMEVSLNYLCREYEGRTLKQFTRGRLGR